MGISLETYALLKAYVDEHGGGGDAGSTPGSITIGTEWSATEPFSIVVTSQDYTITEHTMVSILPKAEVIMQMREDGVQMLYITNNEGTLTAYAVGSPPKTALTVPVLYTEVE